MGNKGASVRSEFTAGDKQGFTKSPPANPVYCQLLTAWSCVQDTTIQGHRNCLASTRPVLPGNAPAAPPGQRCSSLNSAAATGPGSLSLNAISHS